MLFFCFLFLSVYHSTILFIISGYFLLAELIKHYSEVREALRVPWGWGWNRAASAGEMEFLCKQTFSGA